MRAISVSLILSVHIFFGMHDNLLNSAQLHQKKLQQCIDILKEAKITYKTENTQTCFREPTDTVGDYITTVFDLPKGTLSVNYERWLFEQKTNSFFPTIVSYANCSVKLHKKNKLDVMYIVQVKTLPLYQRQGFAKKVFAELLPKLRQGGYSQARLYTSKDVMPFYQQRGFVPLQKQHKYEPLISMNIVLIDTNSGA